MSSRWQFVTQAELERRLLAALRTRPECADISDVAIYPGRDGSWRIGHIRVGRSRRFSQEVIAAVVKRFTKELRLKVLPN
jgi:hypothetical protein